MSTLSVPGQSRYGQVSDLPGRHRARLARARLRRRYRLGPIHRARRRVCGRPLLCASMPARQVVLLVALITGIWLLVGLA